MCSRLGRGMTVLLKETCINEILYTYSLYLRFKKLIITTPSLMNLEALNPLCTSVYPGVEILINVQKPTQQISGRVIVPQESRCLALFCVH